MTQVAKPIVGKDDTKQTLPVVPFSETSNQQSPGLSLVIEAIKDPLRKIHSIGKETHCSHYTNFVRIIERVLLTKPGQMVDIDYVGWRTRRTLEECFCTKIPQSKKAEVSIHWDQAIERLGALEIPLDEQEQQIYAVALQLISLFRGGIMPEDFHTEKSIVIDTYNLFLSDFLKENPIRKN